MEVRRCPWGGKLNSLDGSNETTVTCKENIVNLDSTDKSDRSPCATCHPRKIQTQYGIFVYLAISRFEK